MIREGVKKTKNGRQSIKKTGKKDERKKMVKTKGGD